MTPVRFTPEARADLREIALRIADRNPVRAFTYVGESKHVPFASASSRMPVHRGRSGARAFALPFTADI
jgi:hypothetical protein